MAYDGDAIARLIESGQTKEARTLLFSWLRTIPLHTYETTFMVAMLFEEGELSSFWEELNELADIQPCDPNDYVFLENGLKLMLLFQWISCVNGPREDQEEQEYQANEQILTKVTMLCIEQKILPEQIRGAGCLFWELLRHYKV